MGKKTSHTQGITQMSWTAQVLHSTLRFQVYAYMFTILNDGHLQESSTIIKGIPTLCS